MSGPITQNTSNLATKGDLLAFESWFKRFFFVAMLLHMLICAAIAIIAMTVLALTVR